jgi:hypothetical protein
LGPNNIYKIQVGTFFPPGNQQKKKKKKGSTAGYWVNLYVYTT